MKRLLMILCASSTLLTSAVAQEQQYGWAISFSDTDPFDNSSVPVELVHPYLWLVCGEPGGMSAAAFGVAFTEGSGTVYSFTPLHGFLNAGTATQLLIATSSCPHGPWVVGQFHVQVGAGTTFCIVPDDNGFNVSVDCASPAPSVWLNHTVGLTTSKGPPPCDDRINGLLCYSPVSVEGTSWGKAKSLYR